MADAEAAGNVVEGGGVVVQVHLAVAGGEDGVVRAAFQLQVAFGFHGRGGVVVNDFVRVDDVVFVVENDLAGEGGSVAQAGLFERLPTDGDAGLGERLRLGNRQGLDGQELQAGVVGDFLRG